MTERENIARAAGVVSSATLLSRIFGLIRDLVIAYFFGAGLVADAFFMAFRIPNLLRRFFAEGALTVAYIPIFTEYLTTRSRNDAFELARASLTLFSMILAVVSVLGVLLAPWIVRLFAWGFFDEPEKFTLTVYLTRIMFPYIFLISLVALAMGILNSLGKFAGPALAPVFLNVGMIGSVLLLYHHVNPPIVSLAIGVIIGGIMQVLLQVPFLAREPGLLGISFQFAHPALKRIALLMAPAVVGAAVYQISILINSLLASFLAEGSVSYLYYADRIIQFPLGVFAIAIGTAVLPTMSRQAANQDLAALGDTLSFSLRLVFFITIPATIGLLILAQPLIQLIYQRGLFSHADTVATAQTMIAYACGLWALSAVQILVRTFYALQDTRTPVKIAVASLCGNIILALILMGPFQFVGLALASSGGAVMNFTLLVICLRRRLGRLDARKIIGALLRNLIWSALMGVVVSFILVASASAGGSAIQLAIRVLIAVLAGLVIYAGLAYLGRAPEITSLLNLIRRNRAPEAKRGA